MEYLSTGPQESIIFELQDLLPQQFESIEKYAAFLRSITDEIKHSELLEPPRFREKPHGGNIIFYLEGSVGTFDSTVKIVAKRNRDRQAIGAIYYGHDVGDLSSLMVVKTFDPISHHDEAIERRMREEFEFLQDQDSPFWVKPIKIVEASSIVHSIELGHQSPLNVPHIVLPFVPPGITLYEFCKTKRFKKISGSPEFIACLGIQLCAALHKPQTKKQVLRDLNPHNIMVVNPSVENGFIVCLDANLVLNHNRDRFTKPNMVMGTADFMSPEQIQGFTLSPASDRYLLGCILYFMATGNLPFPLIDPVDRLRAHINQPVDVRQLDRAGYTIKTLVMWLMAKEAIDRPFCVEEVAEYLQQKILHNADPTLREHLGPAADFGLR